jgi:CRP-like cAMP-binding protein
VHSKKENFRAVLRSGRWFANLPPDIQDRVEAQGRLRAVRRGEIFMKHGEAATGLFFVVDGQARGQASVASGKTVLFGIAHVGDVVGFVACADGRPYAMDYVASVDGTMFVLPQPAVREIFFTDVKLYQHLVDPQSSMLRKFVDYLSTTARLTPMQRLAEKILDFSRSYFSPDAEHKPILGLSQELLASSINCTRQTTNELLGELQSRGLIRSEYGRIEVLDPTGLRRVHQPNG